MNPADHKKAGRKIALDSADIAEIVNGLELLQHRYSKDAKLCEDLDEEEAVVYRRRVAHIDRLLRRL